MRKCGWQRVSGCDDREKKIIKEHNLKVKERLQKDTEKRKKEDLNTVLKCPEFGTDVHPGSLRRHRKELCLKSRL